MRRGRDGAPDLNNPLHRMLVAHGIQNIPPPPAPPAPPAPPNAAVPRVRQRRQGDLTRRADGTLVTAKNWMITMWAPAPPNNPFINHPELQGQQRQQPQRNRIIQQNDNDDDDDDDGVFGAGPRQGAMVVQQDNDNDDDSDPAPRRIKFLVMQSERGRIQPIVDDNNPNADGNVPRLHWQGYFELAPSPGNIQGRYNVNQVAVQILRFAHMVGNRWEANPGFAFHLEPRLGTQQQAIDYCTKDLTAVAGTQFTSGQRENADAPGGLPRAAQLIQAGATFQDLARDPTMMGVAIRYPTGLEKVIAANQVQPPIRKVDVFLHYGPTGTGKTHRVYEENNANDIYRKPVGQWWDRYEGQPTLLFDDYTGQIELGEFLNILDKYPYIVQVRGGTRLALWNKVIITSNKTPSEWYPESITWDAKRRESHRRSIAALERRIPEAHRIFMDQKYEPTKFYDDCVAQPADEDHDIISYLCQSIM